MRYLAAGGLLLAAGVLIRVCWLGSQARLTRGAVVSLRLPRLLRSDAAWFEGHRAAAGPLGVAGGAVALAALAVAILGVSNFAGRLALWLGVAAVVGGVVAAVLAAYRAVSAG